MPPLTRIFPSPDTAVASSEARSPAKRSSPASCEAPKLIVSRTSRDLSTFSAPTRRRPSPPQRASRSTRAGPEIVVSGTNGLRKRRSKGPSIVALPPGASPASRASARAASVPSGPVSFRGGSSRRPPSSRHSAGASRPIVPSGDRESSRTMRPRPRIPSRAGALASISPSTDTRRPAPASGRWSGASRRVRSRSVASSDSLAGSEASSVRSGIRPRALTRPPSSRAPSSSTSTSRPRKRARSRSSVQRVLS
jgi:hypothetical protein